MANLWEKAKIPFERPLAEKGVKELFDYFVSNSGARIAYYIGKHGRVNINPETGKTFTEESPDKFTGSINTPEIPLMSCFEIIREPLRSEHESFRENFNLFYGLRFDLAGYDYEEEVPRHDLELIDIVRQKTQEFFESRNHSQE